MSDIKVPVTCTVSPALRRATDAAVGPRATASIRFPSTRAVKATPPACHCGSLSSVAVPDHRPIAGGCSPAIERAARTDVETATRTTIARRTGPRRAIAIHPTPTAPAAISVRPPGTGGTIRAPMKPVAARNTMNESDHGAPTNRLARGERRGNRSAKTRDLALTLAPETASRRASRRRFPGHRAAVTRCEIVRSEFGTQ